MDIDTTVAIWSAGGLVVAAVIALMTQPRAPSHLKGNAAFVCCQSPRLARRRLANSVTSWT